MKVVRQWMIKPFSSKTPVWRFALILPILGALSSCNPTEITGTNSRGNLVNNTDGSITNMAYVYTDSPYILAGPNFGPSNVDMGQFVDPFPLLITENNNLTSNCSMLFSSTTVNLSNCIRTLKSTTSTTQPLTRNADQTYIFDPNSPEFYQVNTMYHLSQGTKTFLNKLSFAYNVVRGTSNFIPKSIPYYLRSSNLFWFKAMSSPERKIFNSDFLTAYAQCELEGNASFSPAGPNLCFGSIKDFPGFFFVQDPTIIYHELGHAFVSILMNLRNGTNGVSHNPIRSNLGSYGYDEAGSINEGIADYISFVMNSREHIGEYALGRTAQQARPLSEASSMHIDGIDETPEGRLAYPQYVLYDPNFPDEPIEDVHYAGQIVTHYLVALTKNFKNTCNLTADSDGGHDRATSYVSLLLAETLSEVGDLNAVGLDNRLFPHAPDSSGFYFNNLDPISSFIWAHQNNQVSYRRFFQIFAKNIYKYISSGLCTGFSKNISEKLLDDYGLLLFKTYNNNGNSTKDKTKFYQNGNSSISPQTLVQVSENNRRKTVLVSKNLVELGARSNEFPNRVSFYLVDNASDMEGLLRDLLFKGFTVPQTDNNAGTEYNNNNIKVSPGEVVAVIPNLFNNSSTTIAGVQLLATDWDHVDVTNTTTGHFKPCVIDGETTVDQGGEEGRSCTTTETSYNRLIKSGNFFPDRGVAPVCMVQLEVGDSTRWVSQHEFRKKQGLALLDKDCLGYSTNNSADQDFAFNPHECLVRFLPGANDAFFSKINPQKTFYETILEGNSQNSSFNVGNAMIMEVNKWIPPGTKFRCRLRARFSNCSDCYIDPETNEVMNDGNDNDDYIDAAYNGHEPFKVINFDFDVND